MTIRNTLFLFLLASLLFLIIACGEKFIFESKQQVPEMGWTYTDSLTYAFQISDTTRLYSMLLDVEHSPDFPSQNVYTKIATIFPDQSRKESVVSLQLMSPKGGQWYATCSADVCRLEMFLQEKTYFNQVGTYQLVIYQNTRQDTLRGISSLALKLKQLKDELEN